MTKPLDRFSDDWNTFGRKNPYGAILTGAAGELPDWNLDEFFATGRADAARFAASLDRIAPASRRHRLLDFGCGVGRVSRALATHFQSVVGIDAAESMIAHARSLNASCRNCDFVVNTGKGLRILDSGTFDVVYSRLVLQHIPPGLVRGFIPELVRVTAPGGVLMFQLPDEFPDEKKEYLNAPVLGNWIKRRLPLPVVRAYRRVKFPLVRTNRRMMFPFVGDRKRQIAMFGMPHHEVLGLLHDAGARILAIEPDQSHGAVPAGYEVLAHSMKVLFVCYGNICRSPMAEALLRRAITDRPELQDVEVASAGVAAIDGNPATKLACAAVRDAFGLDLSAHRARQLDPTVDADMVLALDDETLRAARRLAPKTTPQLFGDYAGTGEEVGDPYGGDRSEYDACARQIDRLMQGVVARLAAGGPERAAPPT